MFDQQYTENFENLYDHFFDPVYKFVFRRINDKDNVHDIVSETFLKIYKNLPGFKPQHEASLAAWIYTIARNEIKQFFRSNKDGAPVALEDVPEISVQDRSPEMTDQHLLSESMRKYLELLEEEDRELIQMKYFDQLGNVEIAETLHLTANHVGVKMHRALEKLKTILEHHRIPYE